VSETVSTKKKLLVIDVAAWGENLLHKKADRTIDGLEIRSMDSIFPGLTCPVQACFRTGSPASRHGMVANGVFQRNLRKPMFWEQSSTLVEGARIWDSFREKGHSVGMFFWQQSLGEKVDMVLSPKPIHKHSGGMIQDCYSQPHDLYQELLSEIGRPFNLMHYWGPLASHKSSDWIVDAMECVLKRDDAPDLIFCYLPHLDYDQQRHGPHSPSSEKSHDLLCDYIQRLSSAARTREYELVAFGDYAIAPAQKAVYPNRALSETGMFTSRIIKGMQYPDFYTSNAFAMVDHEVAHVYLRDHQPAEEVKKICASIDGVAEVLNREEQKAWGMDHPNSGELVLVAEDGSWFVYPWWNEKSEAPDYAGHVDIHNKPGYDPCELFFGWPPLQVSQNPARIHGSHGKISSDRKVAWCSTIDFDDPPDNILELSLAVKSWLNKS